MKVLVVTGSRADRNGLEVVHEALLKAGHQSRLWGADRYMVAGHDCDVAVIGGDRYEILIVATSLAYHRIPIAHIAGGDITRGSADDRYRDAITALSCIHFATNRDAFWRLLEMNRGRDDIVRHTGSPAIDRIHQTPINPHKSDVLSQFCMHGDRPVALVCVHPNTAGGDENADFRAVLEAMLTLDLQCIWLGANADRGGASINSRLARKCANKTGWSFHENVSPQMYYSLMAHCDVMVGNSSAMVYEAPCFGLPCVLVGDRQHGRTIPKNVMRAPVDASKIAVAVGHCLDLGRLSTDENPYGDGHSAPRIVKILEEWHEISTGRPSVRHGQGQEAVQL